MGVPRWKAASVIIPRRTYGVDEDDNMGMGRDNQVTKQGAQASRARPTQGRGQIKEGLPRSGDGEDDQGRTSEGACQKGQPPRGGVGRVTAEQPDGRQPREGKAACPDDDDDNKNTGRPSEGDADKGNKNQNGKPGKNNNNNNKNGPQPEKAPRPDKPPKTNSTACSTACSSSSSSTAKPHPSRPPRPPPPPPAATPTTSPFSAATAPPPLDPSPAPAASPLDTSTPSPSLAAGLLPVSSQPGASAIPSIIGVQPSSSEAYDLSSKAVAGIVAGSMSASLLLGAFVFLLWRRLRQRGSALFGGRRRQSSSSSSRSEPEDSTSLLATAAPMSGGHRRDDGGSAPDEPTSWSNRAAAAAAPSRLGAAVRHVRRTSLGGIFRKGGRHSRSNAHSQDGILGGGGSGPSSRRQSLASSPPEAPNSVVAQLPEPAPAYYHASSVEPGLDGAGGPPAEEKQDRKSRDSSLGSLRAHNSTDPRPSTCTKAGGHASFAGDRSSISSCTTCASPRGSMRPSFAFLLQPSFELFRSPRGRESNTAGLRESGWSSWFRLGDDNTNVKPNSESSDPREK